jgi:hypothetical protein
MISADEATRPPAELPHDPSREEKDMFHKKNRHGPPNKPFSHADNRKILLADPGVQIEWGEIERGHWVATCVCGEEHYRAPDSPRVRNDPYDPATSRHLPQCEFAAATDPAILRALLKIRPGLDPGYQWVECGSCAAGWQVLDYEGVG